MTVDGGEPQFPQRGGLHAKNEGSVGLPGVLEGRAADAGGTCLIGLGIPSVVRKVRIDIPRKRVFLFEDWLFSQAGLCRGDLRPEETSDTVCAEET